MSYNRRSTQVRQKQIADAARKLIIKYGSEHVTAKKIAEEIGISEGAIYRHFKSKRDILSLLIDNIEEKLNEDIEKSKLTARTPLERLDAILKSHLSTVEKRRGVSFQVIAEIVSLGDKRLNTKVSETINRYILRLRDLLAEGVATGEVRADIDLEAAATLLFGMVQALVNIWALANYSFEAEERYQPIWNIFRQSVIKT